MCVQYLWIQSLVAAGTVTLRKIPGEINRSDLMTKHLQAHRMKELLSALGFVFMTGKSRLGLSAV